MASPHPVVLLLVAAALPACEPQTTSGNAAAASRPTAPARQGVRQTAARAALPAGEFRRDEAGYGGSARITGNGDARRLVVALSFKGRPSCDLDGALTPASDGYTVRTSDGPALTLRPTGASGFDLSYSDPAHQPYQVDYCTLGTSIDGHYSAATAAKPTGETMSENSYPSCADVRRAVAGGEDPYEVLVAHYPADLVNTNTVESTSLDRQRMTALMRFTACTVHAGNGDGALADQIAALFKSRRHGAAALDALAEIARGSGADAEAARALSTQMRGYAGGPNG